MSKVWKGIIAGVLFLTAIVVVRFVGRAARVRQVYDELTNGTGEKLELIKASHEAREKYVQDRITQLETEATNALLEQWKKKFGV